GPAPRHICSTLLADTPRAPFLHAAAEALRRPVLAAAASLLLSLPAVAAYSSSYMPLPTPRRSRFPGEACLPGEPQPLEKL
ncbi:unnamed protein product, partial [Urochloa humidicola]